MLSSIHQPKCIFYIRHDIYQRKLLSNESSNRLFSQANVHGWQAKAADKSRKKLRLEDAKEVSTSKPTTLPLTAAASTPENNPTMTPADVEKLEDKVKLAQTRAKGDAKLSRQEFLREKPTAKTRETSAPDRESALRVTSKPKDADGRRVHFAKGANGEAGPRKRPSQGCG